eukprot:Gb_20170 [translate_table: standard]
MGKSNTNEVALAENEENRPCCNASGVCHRSTLKWIVAVIVSVNLLVFGVYSFPVFRKGNGRDGQETAGNAQAQVQACFMLQKPLSIVNASVLKLESAIWEEVGIPDAKAIVISLKPFAEHNWTEVVFGVVPNQENSSISSAGLSLLRATFVGLVLEQYNLSLMPDIFGKAYFFEVLMFPGGITVVPEHTSYPLQHAQVLFNFTLHNSIVQVDRNLAQLKAQLKIGLHVMANENLFVQLTNLQGSTIKPPIIVETSIVSVVGKGLTNPRLKQLAQEITGSHAGNLGLNHTLFGNVKQIKLSSFLRNSSSPPLYVPSPAPSPLHLTFPSPLPAPVSNPSLEPLAPHTHHHHAMVPSNRHPVAPSHHHPEAPCHNHHAFASSKCGHHAKHGPFSIAPSPASSHAKSPRNRPYIHCHHAQTAPAPLVLSSPLPSHSRALSPQNCPHFQSRTHHSHLPSFPLASPSPSPLGSQLIPSPSPLPSHAPSHAGISRSPSHITGAPSVSSPKSSYVPSVILTHVSPPESNRRPHAEPAEGDSPVSSPSPFSSSSFHGIPPFQSIAWSLVLIEILLICW